jgi:hypothetical protein
MNLFLFSEISQLLWYDEVQNKYGQMLNCFNFLKMLNQYVYSSDYQTNFYSNGKQKNQNNSGNFVNTIFVLFYKSHD